MLFPFVKWLCLKEDEVTSRKYSEKSWQTHSHHTWCPNPGRSTAALPGEIRVFAIPNAEAAERPVIPLSWPALCFSEECSAHDQVSILNSGSAWGHVSRKPLTMRPWLPQGRDCCDRKQGDSDPGPTGKQHMVLAPRGAYSRFKNARISR